MRGMWISCRVAFLGYLFFLCEFGEIKKSEVLSKDGVLNFAPAKSE